MFVNSTLARRIGEGWNLTKRFFFRAVPSQEPLSFVILVIFFLNFGLFTPSVFGILYWRPICDFVLFLLLWCFSLWDISRFQFHKILTKLIDFMNQSFKSTVLLFLVSLNGLNISINTVLIISECVFLYIWSSCYHLWHDTLYLYME